jgi:cell division protein FtsZ
MGGGTGTGAAPMIAKQAKELDILTVGIVTIPFHFEGKMRSEQAQKGIENLRSQVDSLIIINNNKLREVYGNLGFKAGFSKADEVLATAAKGIAEVITHHYTQNIDLRDAKTVLANSGTAIMGSSQASGSGRAHEAISKALDSPLLNDNKITGAKNVLLLIVSGSQEITIDEIGEINEYIQAEAGNNANIIMGVGEDSALGEAIAVTVIATGFDQEQQNNIVNTESKKIIHTLEEEQRAAINLTPEKPSFQSLDPLEESQPKASDEVVVHTLDMEEVEQSAPVKEADPLVPTTQSILDLEVTYTLVEGSKESLHSSTPDQEAFLPLVGDFEVVDAEDLSAAMAEETFEDYSENETMDFTNTLFDLPIDHADQQESLVEEASLSSNTPEETIEESYSEQDIAKEELVSEEEAPTITFSLGDDIRDMEVKDPVEVIPVLEYNTAGEKRYSLDDYMELEAHLGTAKEVTPETQERPEEEMVFEKKIVESPKAKPQEEALDPMEAPIEALLKERADERRRKLRDFNYKFNNSINKIEEIEKEPAYKRQGISLSEGPSEGKISRTTLSTDSNEDTQLRSNNSFLHDNVD